MKNLAMHPFNQLVNQWRQIPWISDNELDTYNDFLFQADTLGIKSRHSLDNHQFVMMFQRNQELCWYSKEEEELFYNFLNTAKNRTGISDYTEFVFGYNEIMSSGYKAKKKVWKAYQEVHKKWTNDKILEILKKASKSNYYGQGGKGNGRLTQYFLLTENNLADLSIIKQKKYNENITQPGQESNPYRW